MDAAITMGYLSPSSDPVWSPFETSSIYSSLEERSNEVCLFEDAKLLNKNAVGCSIEGNTLMIDLSKQSKAKISEIFRVLNSKGSAKGDKRSRKEEIEQFLSEKQAVASRQVSKMRHVIPLFLMETYSSLYGQHSFKVKGMWDNRPHDWPHDIPFLDPNNNFQDASTGKSAKPTKDVLVAMLQHLVMKYQEKKAHEPQQSADCPSFPKQVVDDNDVNLLSSGSVVTSGFETLDSTRDAVYHILDRIGVKLNSLQKNFASTEYLPVFLTRYSELLSCSSDSIIIQAHGLEMFIDLLCKDGHLCNGWKQKLMTYSEPMENLVASDAVTSLPSSAGSGCHTSRIYGSDDCIDGSLAGNNPTRSTCDPPVHGVSLMPNLNIETRGNNSEDILSHLSLRPELLNKSEEMDVQLPCYVSSYGGDIVVTNEEYILQSAIELRENGQLSSQQELDLNDIVQIVSGELAASGKSTDSCEANGAVSNAIEYMIPLPAVAESNYRMSASHSQETNVSIPFHVELINDEYDPLYEQRSQPYSSPEALAAAIPTTLIFMEAENGSVFPTSSSLSTNTNSYQPAFAPAFLPQELLSVTSPTGQTIVSMEELSLNGNPVFQKFSDEKAHEELELSTEGCLAVDSVSSTSNGIKRTASAQIPTMVLGMGVDDDEETSYPSTKRSRSSRR